MEMLLIRHGEPRGRGDAGSAGADPGLSEDGLRDADLLADHLASGAVAQPEAVWSSPMLRALETARPVADRLGVAVRTDDRLREFDHGAPAYVAADRAAGSEERAALWRALETGVWGSHRFDPDAFEQRVRAAFDEISELHPGGVVAVVCHAGVINSYLGAVLDRPRGMFCHLEHTSFSRVLVSGRGHRQVHSMNETAHRQAARVAEPVPADGRPR